MWDFENYITLQMFCRSIGVKVSREAAEEVIKGTGTWQRGGMTSRNRETAKLGLSRFLLDVDAGILALDG